MVAADDGGGAGAEFASAFGDGHRPAPEFPAGGVVANDAEGAKVADDVATIGRGRGGGRAAVGPMVLLEARRAETALPAQRAIGGGVGAHLQFPFLEGG